jgi:hypothetical protein
LVLTTLSSLTEKERSTRAAIKKNKNFECLNKKKQENCTFDYPFITRHFKPKNEFLFVNLPVPVLRIHMFLGLLDPDPLVKRYGSGSGFFYHQAKIVRKTLIPTVF